MPLNRIALSCVLGWSIAASSCGGRLAQGGPAPDEARAAPRSVATAPAEETTQDRLNRRRNGILSAPRCAVPPPVDTTGWRPVELDGRPTPLRLPREFQLDTAPDFFHGGVQWRAGARTFFLQNGWWTADGPTACRATFLAGDFIVERHSAGGRMSLAAFPADTVWRPSVVMGGEAGTEAELKLLWTILRSVPPFPWP